jgi:hypothetical protein
MAGDAGSDPPVVNVQLLVPCGEIEYSLRACGIDQSDVHSKTPAHSLATPQGFEVRLFVAAFVDGR